jgi:RNA polymerase sigma-70 factor (ECF subfamily)
MKLAKSLRIVAFGAKRGAAIDQAVPRADFERDIVPHMRAARKLASWLLHNDQDADDAVQDAFLRALQFFDSFNGRDGRKWLLAIVRNTCFTVLQKSRAGWRVLSLDESACSRTAEWYGPQSALIRNEEIERIRRALAALPFEFQQVLELRELRGMAYRQISGLAGIPVGTVMSRLARGRLRLRQILLEQARK